MKSKLPTALIALSLPFVTPGLAVAEDHLDFEYAAQVNCGVNPHNPARIQPGNYSSIVRARNASDHVAKVEASFAFTFPPEGLEPGAVLGPVELALPAGNAVSVGCEDLAGLAGELQVPYFAGILTLLSDRRHNVFATYTVMKDGASTDIAVERIPNSGTGNESRDF